MRTVLLGVSHHAPALAVHPEVVRPLHFSLWQVEDRGTRCLACARNCLLHEDQTGFCTAIVNWQGQLYSTAYGAMGEVSVTPIENRPIYHYRPGTRTLSLGGLGCNLRCAFCQNWEVAFRDASTVGNLSAPNLLPERAIELALERGCQGLAWSFNEPSIAPMYTLESARLAHEAGLYTVFVTNGLMTDQALDLLGPYIDVYRVDVKSLDRAFYELVAHSNHHTSILPIAQRAQQEFGIHVEVVTNLMPTLNDSTDHLSRLANQIVLYLGTNTPWHLTSYVPYAHMTHIAPTSAESLSQARKIGLQAGLRFVYTDAVSAPETANTSCPDCHSLIIERVGRRVQMHALHLNGTCAGCGTDLGIVVAKEEG